MADLPSQPRTRGRPRDPGKREALLDAARALFLEHGPDAVTMDQVVARSGVSRFTLYGAFADKGALLEGVIRRESERIVPDAYLALVRGAGEDLEAALVGFGERLLAFLTHPDTLGFERLMGRASALYPDLAPRLFAAGPGRARETLVALIEGAHGRGQIEAPDAAAAASDLVGLWQGFLRVEMTFAQRRAPGPDDLRERARHGVRQFLRLYAK